MEPSEFLAGYLAEADEHLASATRNLLAVESNLRRGLPSPRPVRELFRSLHTIKGLSAMLGIEPIVAIAHGMEAMLRAADGAGGKLRETALEVLVRGLAAIEQRVRAVGRGETVPAAPADLVTALEDVESPDGAPSAAMVSLGLPPEIASKLSVSEREQLSVGVAAGRRAVRVDFVPSPERAASGLTITTARERVAERGEIVKVVPMSRPAAPDAPGGLAFALIVLTDLDDAAIAAAVGGEAADVQSLAEPRREPSPLPSEEAVVGTRGVVRVEVERLDDALEKLSALVVTRYRIERTVAQLARGAVDVRALTPILQENARQLKELRAAIMRSRMVSARELLERVPLLVRGLSRSTGKAVDLRIDTGSAELDKSVAERVFPAIVHLVRNAVDHALEPTPERERRGKVPAGLLRVTCLEHGSNQLEISVEDDGAGIDREKLARRAGRPLPETNEALLALLTMPGVSTRDEATTTSGRGMGMDIVKRIVVEELGGELTVDTAPGRGTTFTLRIPLTITIVDAFSFRCSSEAFVVPVAGVEEIVEIDPAQIMRAPSGKGRAPVRMIERRGSPMPLIALDTVFRLPRLEMARRKAIVVRRTSQPFAFEVDQMIGQQEVVVRPLEDPLVRTPGVVGSTDLGDGQPTLVLDLVALSAKLSRRKTDARA